MYNISLFGIVTKTPPYAMNISQLKIYLKKKGLRAIIVREREYVCECVSVSMCVSLGIKPRASHMLGKCSTMELIPIAVTI
jgi:hypothetical protein